MAQTTLKLSRPFQMQESSLGDTQDEQTKESNIIDALEYPTQALRSRNQNVY